MRKVKQMKDLHYVKYAWSWKQNQCHNLPNDRPVADFKKFIKSGIEDNAELHKNWAVRSTHWWCRQWVSEQSFPKFVVTDLPGCGKTCAKWSTLSIVGLSFIWKTNSQFVPACCQGTWIKYGQSQCLGKIFSKQTNIQSKSKFVDLPKLLPKQPSSEPTVTKIALMEDG